MGTWTGARAALVTAAVCAGLATNGNAFADEPPIEFGTPGTVVISGAFRASYSKSTSDATQTMNESIGTNVNGDVFVAPGLSLGLSGLWSYGKASYAPAGQPASGYRGLVGGGALRVGYYVPLGARVGFWPVASAGLIHVSAHGDSVQGSEGSAKQLTLLAQFLFHVDRGWFLSVTPALVAYSTSSDGIGQLGAGPSVALGFGGYF